MQAAERAQRAYAWLTAAERLRAAAPPRRRRGRGADARLAPRPPRLAAALLRPGRRYRRRRRGRALAARIGDAILERRGRWLRAASSATPDRFRAGLRRMMEGTSSARGDARRRVEGPTAMPGRGSSDALAGTESIESGLRMTRRRRGLQADGADFRRRPRSLVLRLGRAASARRSTAASGSSPSSPTLPERQGSPLPPPRLPTTDLASPMPRWADPMRRDRPGRAPRGLPRSRPSRPDRLLALHRAAGRGPAHMTRPTRPTGGIAAEAEAALSRAGGALRPGVSPRSPGSTCLILDGRVGRGGPHLAGRCRSPATPTCGARSPPRAPFSPATVASRKSPGRRSAPSCPKGPPPSRVSPCHQEGLFLQRLAADLCLDAGDLPGPTPG